MKKLNVIVREKTVLELAEDGFKGDLIDLKEVTKVDTSYLESIIETGKDKVYLSKLEDVKKALNAEHNAQITQLEANIELLKKENESNLKIKESEMQKQYDAEMTELKKKIEVLESTKKSDMEALSNKKQAEFNQVIAEAESKYKDLESKYNVIMSQYENQLNNVKLEKDAEWTKKINELETKFKLSLADKESEIEKIKLSSDVERNKELAEQKSKFDEEIKAKEDIINNLQRAKASMNVKQTGEDLESWCDNEVTSYMQNGLFNCTWIKDNKVVKEGEEVKGSKADYIFKVYANNKHNENELLASVCLDMKDENPDTIKKTPNEKYYKDLDKNREKKNCKYSVLVSNLETDKPNVLPIFKVREYENMYVVRPGYLMVFLNMIASLTTRFAELVLSKEAQKLELKTKLEMLELFDSIKNTYLDKPLTALENDVKEIVKNSDSIKKACKNIDEQCEKINKSYISQINKKIENFELKFNKGVSKNLE